MLRLFKSNTVYFILILGSVFCLFPFNSNASKLKKAYKALSIYNYFEAKRLFEKIESKQPAAATYGLTLIYVRQDNPFYNLDSAYNKINKCVASFSILTLDNKTKLENFGITQSTINQLRLSVSTQFFQFIVQNPTVELLDEFQVKHPWSREWMKAGEIRDSMAYFEAFKKGQSTEMKFFIDKYPMTKYQSDAEDRFEWLVFLEETRKGTLECFEKFDTTFTTNRYRIAAQDSIYRKLTLTNRLQDFDRFIQRYPSNRNIPEAWRTLYQKFLYEFTADKVDVFIEKYPDFPFKEEMEVDRYFYKVQLIPMKKGNLYGWMDLNGNEVIKPDFESVGFFKEGLAWVEKEGKFGYVNKKNEVIIPLQFDAANDFEDGRAVVTKNNKYALIDRVGSYITDFDFTELGQFDAPLIYAQKDKLYGYIDVKGKFKIEPQFEEAFGFENGYAKVVLNEKEAIIDSTGKKIIAPIYDQIDFFSPTHYRAKDNGSFFLVAKSNDTVKNKVKYDDIGNLVNDRALVVKNGMVGYINGDGVIEIPLMYQRYPNDLKSGLFSDGYVKVYKNNKYGILDSCGNEIVPFVNESANLINKLISVKRGGKVGVVNLKNETVIQFNYDLIDALNEYYFLTRFEGQFGVITKTGRGVLPNSFSTVKLVFDKFFIAEKNGKFGVLNATGQVVVPFEYESIKKINDEILLLSSKSKLNYYHWPTNRIIAPIGE